jgi:hypothetical protein
LPLCKAVIAPQTKPHAGETQNFELSRPGFEAILEASRGLGMVPLYRRRLGAVMRSRGLESVQVERLVLEWNSSSTTRFSVGTTNELERLPGHPLYEESVDHVPGPLVNYVPGCSNTWTHE